MRLIDADSFKTDLMASAIDAKEDFIREKDWRFCVEVTKNFLRDIDERPTIDHADILAGMWVPVSERLPEHFKDVLVMYESGRIDFDRIDHDEDWLFNDLYGSVTHWMPLPQPPKEDKP